MPRRAPTDRRTRYRGCLRPFWLRDPESQQPRRFRVAYIHSSEKERERREARERSLRKAEEALARIGRSRGRRLPRSLEELERRAARALPTAMEDLFEVRCFQDRAGRPTLSWRRDDRAIAGVVAKRLGSPYLPGARNGAWVKHLSASSDRCFYLQSRGYLKPAEAGCARRRPWANGRFRC